MEDRNLESHLEDNTTKLLASIMGLEQFAHESGRLEATLEGVALGFMVQLLGRMEFNNCVRVMVRNQLDYDPPSQKQLKRVREFFEGR